MKSRFLRRMIANIVSEAPDRTPEEQDHLDNPRTPEAATLLRFVPTLALLPLDDGLRELVPAVAMMLQNVALECEEARPEAEARRAEVGAWLAEIRKAIA